MVWSWLHSFLSCVGDPAAAELVFLPHLQTMKCFNTCFHIRCDSIHRDYTLLFACWRWRLEFARLRYTSHIGVTSEWTNKYKIWWALFFLSAAPMEERSGVCHQRSLFSPTILQWGWFVWYYDLSQERRAAGNSCPPPVESSALMWWL